MFIDKYPYTNFHELNLDFLLNKIRELESEISEFVARNSIKYADPFQWNITTQYGKNTVTIDANTGVAYLSIQPVPTGIAITDTNYWTPVFDLGQMFMDFNDNLSHNDEEQNVTSAHHYNTDDWLIWKNQLYLVIAEIHIGDGFVPGLNIESKSVEELFDLFTSDLVNRFDTFMANLTANDEGDNATSASSYAVNDWLLWNDALYLVTVAINPGDTLVPGTNIEAKTVEDLISTIASDLSTAQGDISNLQNDMTNAQNDITNINNSIIAINNAIAGVNSRNFDLGYMIMLTDSFGENISPNITDYVPSYLNMTAGQYLTHAAGGCGFGPSCPANYLTELQSIAGSVPDASKVKTILVTGGSNDVGYGDTEVLIENAISSFMTYCKTTYPNARVYIAFTGWCMQYTSATWNPARFRIVLDYYTKVTEYGGYLLKGIHAAMHKFSNFNGDDIHPNATGQLLLGKAIANALVTGDCDIHINAVGTVSSAAGYSVQGTWNIEDRIDNEIITSRINGSGTSPNPRVVFSNNFVVSASAEPSVIWIGTIDDYCIGNAGAPYIGQDFIALFTSNELTRHINCRFVRQVNNFGLIFDLPPATYTSATMYLPTHLEIKADIYNC